MLRPDLPAAGPGLRPATSADFPRLAETLVRAFASDPFHLWLFPDAAGRYERQRRLFERVLAIYGKHGVVYTTPDFSGVAMWDPPREGGPSLVELLAFVFRVLPVFGTRAGLIARGMAPMATLHPDEPHWYLSVLGTDPSRQKNGVGTSLLRPVLERCDAGGYAAYLEASRIENVPYYERFGFEVVAPLAMPKDGPVVYRMKRDARSIGGRDAGPMRGRRPTP
ncbi:MAG TPA: GNAT family N-acetyltransferase [Candidatus Limnocylindrales bacterium]|nr:GNAT family N-acetyltransferase [Candidatus Limnocylindrales bacterium]